MTEREALIGRLREFALGLYHGAAENWDREAGDAQMNNARDVFAAIVALEDAEKK